MSANMEKYWKFISLEEEEEIEEEERERDYLDNPDMTRRSLQELSGWVDQTKPLMANLMIEANRVLFSLRNGVFIQINESLLNEFLETIREFEYAVTWANGNFEEDRPVCEDAGEDRQSKLSLMPKKKELDQIVHEIRSDALKFHYLNQKIENEWKKIYDCVVEPGEPEDFPYRNYPYKCITFNILYGNCSDPLIIDERDRIGAAMQQVLPLVNKLNPLLRCVLNSAVEGCTAKHQGRTKRIPEGLLKRRRILLRQLEKKVPVMDERIRESKANPSDVWRILTPLAPLETLSDILHEKVTEIHNINALINIFEEELNRIIIVGA